MRKIYLSVGALSLFSLLTLNTRAQQIGPCSYDEHRNKLMQTDPEFAVREAKSLEFVKRFIENGGGHKDNQVYIVPIVIHVVHQYGAENISDEQILDQMRILNRDFRKLNADTSRVVNEFKALVGDARIEFRLATIDPDGNCTTGIERLVSKLTNDGGNNEARFNAWDYNKYFNIWVCKDLGGAAGYSVGYDVAMRSDYTGSIGTSGEYGSRALTHEVGHWASLPHVWGNTNPGTVCGDEGIDDTPITKGYLPGSVSCDAPQSQCNAGIIENHQNYMDYAYCQMMFTTGQVANMRARLNDPGAYHIRLWQSGNLAATGTDGTTDKYCAPKPDFYANKDVACVNTPVIFRDNSSVGFVSSRTWTFQDADITTSSALNPTVRFNSPGWKTVTLTVSNAQGEASKTNTKSIFVSNASVAETVPYLQTFADASVFGDKWIVKNYEENQTSFTQSTTAGFSDTKSAKMNGFNSPNGKTLKDGNGDVDAFLSPTFNLSGKEGWLMSFKISVATKSFSPNNMSETLKLEYSTNCGNNWINIKELSKAELSTVGYTSSNFTPSSAGQWKEVAIPLTSGTARDNIRFRFTYTSASTSNNLYLDDFRIAPASGIAEDLAKSAQVAVYPNPLTSASVLTYTMTGTADVNVLISDITGKTVATKTLGSQAPGDQSVELQPLTEKLKSGVYLLTLQLGKGTVTKKLIINQ
ncbi:MAG: M43 family zinc metalloprotease [Bacteroidota bacterium]